MNSLIVESVRNVLANMYDREEAKNDFDRGIVACLDIVRDSVIQVEKTGNPVQLREGVTR